MNKVYLLDYLKWKGEQSQTRSVLKAEFRLTCSGQLFSGPNPYQNIFSRVLLEKPFGLFIALPEFALPTKFYPQELALRLTVPRVEEKTNNSYQSFFPVREIVQDIAALLTLCCRRLVTVAGCIMHKEEPAPEHIPPEFLELPHPIATALTLKYWPQQPMVTIHFPSRGEPETDQPPRPKRFDTERIQHVFERLPDLQHAERIVLAARLYAAAMAAVFETPDIAYVLATMSVESLANQAVENSDALSEAKKSVPPKVREGMTLAGLSEEQIRTVHSLYAVPGPTFKFQRFLVDHVTDEAWTDDDLFKIADWPPSLRPSKERFAEAVKEVYAQRNKYVHHGHPYPKTISVGLRTMDFSDNLFEAYAAKLIFPPFIWFERVVHVALVNYIEKQIAAAEPPSRASSS